jgi:hypothetical protein
MYLMIADPSTECFPISTFMLTKDRSHEQAVKYYTTPLHVRKYLEFVGTFATEMYHLVLRVFTVKGAHAGPPPPPPPGGAGKRVSRE